MARAAGSNDPEVVIVKFISRNETRAGLLDERGQVLRRRAGLDAEHQQLSAKCAAPPTKRPPPPSCPPHASGSTPPLTRLSPPPRTRHGRAAGCRSCSTRWCTRRRLRPHCAAWTRS